MSFFDTVDPAEIKRRRSLNNLGGEIQETEIPDNTVHALFDKVDEQGARLGEINYRAFYFFNSNKDLPIKNPILYCPLNTTSSSDDIRYGWEPNGVNKVMQSIPDEYTPPLGIAWNSGASRTTGSPLGTDIPPLGMVGVWEERTVNFNAPSQFQNTFEIDLDYDRTDRVIPENWGVAVMGNMGCASIFNQICSRAELRAPSAVLSTGGNSYKADGSCWLSSIQPLDAVWKMAFGETEVKSQSLINQYKNFFGLNKEYYSFNIYNVHFLVITASLKFASGSDQYTFIVNDLKNASKDPRIDWIIVCQQNPFWHATDKSGKFWSIQTFRDLYSPIFEANKVHLVLQGGPYNYQRLGVVNPIPIAEGGDTVTTQPIIVYGASRGWTAKNGAIMANTISHEIIEAMTDPDYAGQMSGKRGWKWYNNNPRWEIADFCDVSGFFGWSYGTGDDAFYPEPYWSNSDAGCCIPGLNCPDTGNSTRITNADGGPVLSSPKVYLIYWGAYWADSQKSQSQNQMYKELFDHKLRDTLLTNHTEYFSKIQQYGSPGIPTWGGSVVNTITPIPSGTNIGTVPIAQVIKDTFSKGLLPVPTSSTVSSCDIYLVIIPPDKILADEYGGYYGWHDIMKPKITVSKQVVPQTSTGINAQDPDYFFEGKGFAKGFLSVIVGNTGGHDETEELDKITMEPLPEWVKKTEWDKHGYLWLEWTNQGRKINGRLYTKQDISIDNFTITNTSNFGGIPPPPTGGGGGGGTGGTGGGGTPQPIPLDDNGIQWLVATGSIFKHPQSRNQTNDFRWSKNYKNVGDYGYECCGIFTFTGVAADGHWALKHWGANHTAPCPHKEGGSCCCWYDTGIRSNGDVQLQIERPHPHNSDFKEPLIISNIGTTMNGHTIGLKWVVYPIKVGGNADDGSGIKLKMWVDTNPLNASGKPNNNWTLVYDITDKGQILGDYVAPSEQEIESRNSDTKSTSTYAGGLHVRLIRAGDTDPDKPVPPPPTPGTGGTGTPSATWGAVGDWDCNSTTDATISTLKSWNPGLILGLGDYSYQNTKTCWINKIEAANIQNLLEITLGNHETAEGTPSSLKDEYKTYFGYSNYWHAHTFQNIRFICMCSELDFTSGSAQYTFVSNELAAAKNNAAIKWIVVYCHSPFYPPNGSHHPATEWSPTLRATYHTLFKTNNVDLVLYGHNHNYDRSFPLDYNSSSQGSPTVKTTQMTDYVNMQGSPIFVTVGTGGRSHYSIGNASPFTAVRSDTWFGALRCDISNQGNTLTFKAIKNDGSVFDSWKMTKTVGGGGGDTTGASPPAGTLDTFGIKMLNGTKVGGRVWNSNWHTATSHNWTPSAQVPGNFDPQDNMCDLICSNSCKAVVDAATDTLTCDTNTDKASWRFYVKDPACTTASSPWKWSPSCEVTVYYRVLGFMPGGSIDVHVRVIGPNEHWCAISDCFSSGHEYGFEIKGNGTIQLRKEEVHMESTPDGYAENIISSFTDVPENQWIGLKLVTQKQGSKMLVQGWRDMTDGLNGGNWVKVVEKLDDGTNWKLPSGAVAGWNATSAGSGNCTKVTPMDRVLDMPSSACGLRVDNNKVNFKKFSIREIDSI